MKLFCLKGTDLYQFMVEHDFQCVQCFFQKCSNEILFFAIHGMQNKIDVYYGMPLILKILETGFPNSKR